MLIDIGIEPKDRKVLRAIDEAAQYASACDAWELTYRAQMAEAGLHVQTVGEGIDFLLGFLPRPSGLRAEIEARNEAVWKQLISLPR